MSTELIDLNDRIVTDKGEVIAKHALLMRKALSGEVFTDLRAVSHPDVERYNQVVGDTEQISIWTPSGDLEGPDPETFEWTIPKAFQELNIYELAVDSLIARGLATNEAYGTRLQDEFDYIIEHRMEEFFRCLLYVTEQFRASGVVWGVGRGSSCASLVLFLLGINRVDPVKYDIPMEEFYK